MQFEGLVDSIELDQLLEYGEHPVVENRHVLHLWNALFYVLDPDGYHCVLLPLHQILQTLCDVRLRLVVLQEYLPHQPGVPTQVLLQEQVLLLHLTDVFEYLVNNFLLGLLLLFEV